MFIKRNWLLLIFITLVLFSTGCGHKMPHEISWLHPPDDVATTFSIIREADSKVIAYNIGDKYDKLARRLLRDIPFVEITAEQYTQWTGSRALSENRYFLMRATQAAPVGAFQVFNRRGSILILFSGLGEPFDSIKNVPVAVGLKDAPHELYNLTNSHR